MMTNLPTYRVYAAKYAERDGQSRDMFLGGDAHNSPMPMDYFVWAVVGPDRTWVIDTGFEDADAEARGRRMVRSVTEALATVGVDALTVEDVIITHLHYDHIGGFGQFPAARFHVQDREMAFATGRHMTRRAIAHSFTADHIAGLVHKVFDQRVTFHDGDKTLAPGLSVHWVGGHTAGLQVVRVHTALGWMVLASDAAHYYDNLEQGRPFPTLVDVGQVLDAFDTVRELADRPELIVPGHDPLVLARYPAAAKGLDGIAVRLDQELTLA